MALRWVCLAALLLLGSPGLPHCHADIIEEEIIPVKHVQQLGGWNELPTTSKDAQRMAAFVESNFNEEDAECRYQTTKIQHAEVQVVNGFNFRLQLEMKKTGCQDEVVLCDVQIFENMRGDTKTITEKDCMPANE